MLKNTEDSYGAIAKLLHWIIALAIISLITVGFIMSSMEPAPDKYELYGMHKASGVIVLMLIILRLIWKFNNKAVLPPTGFPKVLALAAAAGHFMLYVFMFVMPISGLLMSYFGGHDVNVFGMFIIESSLEKNSSLAGLFHGVHTIGVWAFIAVIVMHVGAALYHHFIRKDNVLMRMIK